MIVAIAGPIGVGKSTVARGLAARLSYRYISGGEVFREIARARGISLTEVNKLAEQDPSLDRELDRRQQDLARAGNCVVESRLAGWMVEADLKIWLRAPLDIRASRVARREGQPLEAARVELQERERSEWARYKQVYDIDITMLSPYHVIIDTSYWDADEIAETLAGLVQSIEIWSPGPGIRDPVPAKEGWTRR
jgi:cytidylate kinase